MNISYNSNPSDNPVNARNPKHLHTVKTALPVTVAASGVNTSAFWEVDVSAYAFLIIVVRTETAHAHRVAIGWNHDNGSSLGAMAPEVNIFTSSQLRDGESDWIPNKGEKCFLTIRNDDTSESHTYDVILYGVN